MKIRLQDLPSYPLCFGLSSNGKTIDCIKKGQPTKYDWDRHFNGEVAIALIPLMPNDSVYWGVIKDITKNISYSLFEPTYINKDAWFILEEPFNAWSINKCLTKITKSIDARDIHPRQWMRTDNINDVGDMVIMPFFGKGEKKLEYTPISIDRLIQVSSLLFDNYMQDEHILTPCLEYAKTDPDFTEKYRTDILLNMAAYYNTRGVKWVSNIHKYQPWLKWDFPDFDEVSPTYKITFKNRHHMRGYYCQNLRGCDEFDCSKCWRRPFGIGDLFKRFYKAEIQRLEICNTGNNELLFLTMGDTRLIVDRKIMASQTEFFNLLSKHGVTFMYRSKALFRYLYANLNENAITIPANNEMPPDVDFISLFFNYLRKNTTNKKNFKSVGVLKSADNMTYHIQLHKFREFARDYGYDMPFDGIESRLVKLFNGHEDYVLGKKLKLLIPKIWKVSVKNVEI